MPRSGKVSLDDKANGMRFAVCPGLYATLIVMSTRLNMRLAMGSLMLWMLALPAQAQPAAWTCEDSNYDNSDGCDCGCGIEDPDCGTPNVVLCAFTHCPADEVVSADNPAVCEPDVCGNGIRGQDEVCDDGGEEEGGCSDNCRVVSAGFQCGDFGCQRSRCGDGVWDLPEQCDDGNDNNGDGCSRECQGEPGYVCFPEQPNPFEPGFARNGRTTLCVVTFCGNGGFERNLETGTGESCEDFNDVEGDGCDRWCQEEPGWFCPPFQGFCSRTVCNDGILSGDLTWGVGESCEDGNTTNGDGCDANCQVEPGYDCFDENFGQITPCHIPVCGDSYIDRGQSGESCDDGNTDSDDGCSNICRLEPGFDCNVTPCVRIECGNGIPQCDPQTGQCESCDDGNANSGDGCSTFCQIERGFTCFGFQPTMCVAIECGNGLQECDNFECEACDDGNDNGGDGCTATCNAIEPGFICPNGGGPCRQPECGDGIRERDPFTGQMLENCDDGNDNDGDGCNSDCDLEPGFECVRPGDPCLELPDGWLCSTQFYDVGDGCDCGCGSIDPDCDGDSFNDCNFNQCFDGNLTAIDPCDIGSCVSPEQQQQNLAICTNGSNEGEGEATGEGEGEGPDTISIGGAGCPRGAGAGIGLLLLASKRRRRKPSQPNPMATCLMAVMTMTSFAASAQPATWTCAANNYDVSDGCDCGCGAPDPDCRSDDVRECSYSHCVVPQVPSTNDPTTCVDDQCGNGIRGSNEACDDGGDNDGGCNDDCTVVEPGFTCTEFGCQRSRCGDGEYTFPERCDDGNNADGDGCDRRCVEEPGFVCYLNSFDRLGRPFGISFCRSTFCGDFNVEYDYGTRNGESCDDGNNTDGDGCDSRCEQEPGFFCMQGVPTCQPATCGDGVVDGSIFPPSGEQCDDGNTNDGDGCSSTCQPESGYLCFDEFNYQFTECYVPRCGDGHITRSISGLASESCDDGNTASDDGCSSFCVAEPGWDCNTAGPGQPCLRVECGNSFIQCGNFGCESCDDGNTVSGDGCSADCYILEFGFICPNNGGPCRPVCGDGFADRDPNTGQRLETCDDANTTNGDGCDNTCQIEAGFECTTQGQPCTELPDGWLCSVAFYDTGDLCDCGCGSPDPDCPTTARNACRFNHCFDGNLIALDPCDPTSCVTEASAAANLIECPIDVPVAGEGEGEASGEGEGEVQGPTTISLGGGGCPRGAVLWLPLFIGWRMRKKRHLPS
jgi:cysteine-rich repeat protein